ncbi:DUF2092 domain-containing protein [Synechocystis sp. LKSZ1]|uniref:DUF2092 domain-containing protein n=1 Tax=Synechocystis sp. LKSZ1 TaxID=3144951 RepID=UPI00336BF95A
MRYFLRLLALASFWVSLGLDHPQLLAQPSAPSPPAETPTAPRTADQLLDQVCDFLKGQKNFSVEMDITYDDNLEDGGKIQYSAYQTLFVEKPNHLRSDYVGDERTTNFYYNGLTFTLQEPNLKYYSFKTAPKTLDEVLDHVEAKYGVTIPMSNLVASDPCADLKANVTDIIFAGMDMVNREEMYHLLLLGSTRDYQMWLTQDEQPLLRKAIITYKNLPNSPQYTAIFSTWNFNPDIPVNTFNFSPSPDDIKIDFIPTDKLKLTPNN